MVVGNDASQALGSDMNSVVFAAEQGSLALEGVSKREVARRLASLLAQALDARDPGSRNAA